MVPPKVIGTTSPSILLIENKSIKFVDFVNPVKVSPATGSIFVASLITFKFNCSFNLPNLLRVKTWSTLDIMSIGVFIKLWFLTNVFQPTCVTGTASVLNVPPAFLICVAIFIAVIGFSLFAFKSKYSLYFLNVLLILLYGCALLLNLIKLFLYIGLSETFVEDAP